MPKLGYYLPFEQKIQKRNFFQEKPKNLYLGGQNQKKLKITLFALFNFSKFPAIFPFPPFKADLEGLGGEGVGTPSYMRGFHCSKTVPFPLLPYWPYPMPCGQLSIWPK